MLSQPKKPSVVPPEEKPTQPNRKIPEYPGREKKKPVKPYPIIPEIKPTK